ncbi:hypothetical protein BRARA_F01604 [Brassica rapa]|uniref:Uncharacterized protein n=2 Tax=Brassica campestris TaxID=3711 RepID=A0A397Z087_BRACM|nr:hypothetical protein IGI04_022896 [Brassica rapa subsp. trilocularis]RID58298.1 hypothetical protein BRARA_F01604 [Brassica rapa]
MKQRRRLVFLWMRFQMRRRRRRSCMLYQGGSVGGRSVNTPFTSCGGSDGGGAGGNDPLPGIMIL